MFGGHNLPPTHSHLRFLRRHHFIFGISIAFRSHRLLNPSIELKYDFVLGKNRWTTFLDALASLDFKL